MSGNARPACPTARQALSQAILAAVEKGTGSRLLEVNFGRYSDLNAGWHWELKFVTEVASEPKAAVNEDSTERRVFRVTDAWVAAIGKYSPGDLSA